MKILYLEDSYLREWKTKVSEIFFDGTKNFVILEESAFYPGGGGQPRDEGKIIRCEDNKEFKITNIEKKEEKIFHETDQTGLRPGDEVKCFLDWEKRYRMMRMHTAAHILSGIIEEETGALISGNQLGFEKSRIDFT
ncbi:MAG: alanyl-tRNA editing protein, partial [Candidatus Pacearchaeota archaeon]|nr:alanyl-tRNA editing protein [Candidatus Pacearchaeota archaeon]